MEVSGLELSGWPKIQGQGGQLRCKSSEEAEWATLVSVDFD